MSYADVIECIENLPRFRTFTCKQCGNEQQVYSLLIHANCQKCQARVKLRGYASLGSEIEDVLDAALAWLGRGDEFELAMERKRVIDSSTD